MFAIVPSTICVRLAGSKSNRAESRGREAWLLARAERKQKSGSWLIFVEVSRLVSHLASSV